MSALAVDTHVVIWYLTQPQKLSQAARDAIVHAEGSGGPIYVSAISLVEMRYLVEKGRLMPTLIQQTEDALDDPSSPLLLVPIDRAVTRSLGGVARNDVPDMPDRIIAATALYLDVPLITRDGLIRAASITTIW